VAGPGQQFKEWQEVVRLRSLVAALALVVGLRRWVQMAATLLVEQVELV